MPLVISVARACHGSRPRSDPLQYGTANSTGDGFAGKRREQNERFTGRVMRASLLASGQLRLTLRRVARFSDSPPSVGARRVLLILNKIRRCAFRQSIVKRAGYCTARGEQVYATAKIETAARRVAFTDS